MEIWFKGGSYYKGTKEQFYAFFNQLVTKITQLLATTHISQLYKDEEKHKQYMFTEIGKDIIESTISVFIDYTLYSTGSPTVNISIYVKK